jgi:oxygen-independent coproporphyrinogen-3 oxidase
MLEVDEDSRLGKELLLGGIRYGALDTPSDDATAAFYEIAVERLIALGIERYEISNFARPGHESRHNLKYRRLDPYVGLGADAHSFDGAVRSQNGETVDDYLAGRGRHSEPAAGDERLFIGLRLTRGIRPSPTDWRRFEQPIRRFLDRGLLETDGDILRLTSRGVLLSNEVFQEFLAP